MKQTLQTLLISGRETLKRAGIREPELDAKYLLLEAFRIDPVHFLMDRCRELPDDERIREMVEHYREMVRMRTRRIPLQQILGAQDFMGLTFFVDRHVLIPRQDTETLVELVLQEHPGKGERVLDLCTGSGCIAISLAVLGDYGKIVGVDLSPKALKVAAKNRESLLGQESAWKKRVQWEGIGEKSAPPEGLWKKSTQREGAWEKRTPPEGLWEKSTQREGAWEKRTPPEGLWEKGIQQDGLGGDRVYEACTQEGGRVELLEGDLFAALGPGRERFDILTANPPYIPTQTIEGLEPEVKDHEPRMALDGHEDGLAFYRRIASEGGAYLKKGADIYLEIGYDQGAAVGKILRQAGMLDVRIVKDAAGNDRVAAARWPG